MQAKTIQLLWKCTVFVFDKWVIIVLVELDSQVFEWHMSLCWFLCLILFTKLLVQFIQLEGRHIPFGSDLGGVTYVHFFLATTWFCCQMSFWGFWILPFNYLLVDILCEIKYISKWSVGTLRFVGFNTFYGFHMAPGSPKLRGS